MHIKCTGHHWQIDHIHSQAIIDFQWWSASSLKYSDYYLEQMNCLSVVQADFQRINPSSGFLVAWVLAQAVAWAVTWAIGFEQLFKQLL